MAAGATPIIGKFQAAVGKETRGPKGTHHPSCLNSLENVFPEAPPSDFRLDFICLFYLPGELDNVVLFVAVLFC